MEQGMEMTMPKVDDFIKPIVEENFLMDSNGDFLYDVDGNQLQSL